MYLPLVIDGNDLDGSEREDIVGDLQLQKYQYQQEILQRPRPPLEVLLAATATDAEVF